MDDIGAVLLDVMLACLLLLAGVLVDVIRSDTWRGVPDDLMRRPDK